MIKSFKHKGLKALYKTGSTKGVVQDHVRKLTKILQLLDAATVLEDMNYPGSNLHSLSGNLADHHAVWVNKNWRVIFKFINGDAYVVNYLDYHKK